MSNPCYFYNGGYFSVLKFLHFIKRVEMLKTKLDIYELASKLADLKFRSVFYDFWDEELYIVCDDSKKVLNSRYQKIWRGYYEEYIQIILCYCY